MTTGASRRRLAPNVEGALWMLLSSATFVVMSTMIKYLGTDYPAALQNFYRQAAGLLMLAPFILRAPKKVLNTSRMGVLMFRSVTSTGGMILMFYSFQRLPLAEANALSFTRPLWVTLLAAVILREALGLPRILAVLVGFVGVLVILRPWDEGMAYGLPQLAALGSSLLLALSITGVKSLTRDYSPLSVMAWGSLLGVVLTFPLALSAWRWPSPPDLGLLALMGMMGVLNQTIFIKGMSVGDAAAMAPIDYTRLVFAGIVGFFMFSEVPDPVALLGAMVIVVSTLYITIREVRAARRARAEAEIAPVPRV